MREDLARELIALDNRFYMEHAVSFSATRGAPWQGWGRVLEGMRAAGALGGARPVLLDAACGNLRLERWLAEELPGIALAFHAVDACAPLAGGGPDAPAGTTFHHVDILGALLAGKDPFAGIPACDIAVCFGFLHHVPGADLRMGLLRALTAHTRPGGVIALSAWRFMDDPRLAAKAARAEAEAASRPPWPGCNLGALEPGDHLLGWQDARGAYRYCHHADEAELDALAASVADLAREEARFSADGASGALNRYLLLRRRAE